jgi:hypothetical protein
MFDFDELDRVEAQTTGQLNLEAENEEVFDEIFDFNALEDVEPEVAQDPSTCEGSTAASEDDSTDAKIQQAMAEAFQRRWLESNTESQDLDQRIQNAMKSAIDRHQTEAGAPDDHSKETGQQAALHSADRIALNQRIHNAFKGAVNRHQTEEIGAHDGNREAATAVYDQEGWQSSHCWQEHQWSTQYHWQEPYGWPQFDSRMQPAVVTQSDGRCAAGFTWEPACDQWSGHALMTQPQPLQFQDWQSPTAEYAKIWMGDSVKVQRHASLKPEQTGPTMPRPWASEITHTPKKSDEAASVANAESPAPITGPMPVPVKSKDVTGKSKDLRSSWREQVNKRLAERHIKRRGHRHTSEDETPSHIQPDSPSSSRRYTTMEFKAASPGNRNIHEDDLNQIGETLQTLYTRRHELDKTYSEDVFEKKMPSGSNSVKKSVAWADMNSDGEGEGFSPRQRASGGG